MTIKLLIVLSVITPLGVWVTLRIGSEAIEETIRQALNGPRLPHELGEEEEC